MQERPSMTTTSALVMAPISRPCFARKRASTLRIERPARRDASPASRCDGSTQTAISGTDRPMTSSREYPVARRKASFTSTIRPSSRPVTVRMVGLSSKTA